MPLAAPLRGRLIEGLTEASPNDAEVTLLLGRYDIEPDPTVKLLAATAYAGRLVATNAVTEEVIDAIAEQARATGPDHHDRRAAAFGALARLGRLDRLTSLRERFGDHALVRIQHSSLSDGVLFYRTICDHWEGIKAAFGDDPFRRFEYGNNSEIWQRILTVAHDYPMMHSEIASQLERQPTLATSAAGITYLSKVEPHSDRLWQAIMSLLQRAHAQAYAGIQPAWLALNILEDQFSDDPRTSAWLDTKLAPPRKTDTTPAEWPPVSFWSFGTLAAISRLRPTHPTIQGLLKQIGRIEGQPWTVFCDWTELAASTTPNAQGFVDLAVEISRIVRTNDMFPEYIYRPLTARLRRDASMAAALAALVPALSGDAFGICVRLLSLSTRLDSTLVAHLSSRLSTPNDQDQYTFDPFFGQARHSELLVLDILDTIEI